MPPTRAIVSDRALARLADQEREVDQVRMLLDDLGVDPSAVSIGTADRLVLAQAEALTGRPLELTATCSCGAVNAAALAVADLPAATTTSRWLGPGTGLRAPTWDDLLALRAEEAGVALLRRCTIGTPPSAPSAGDLAELDDALAGPVMTTCVDCGDPLELDVDLVTEALRRLVQVAATLDREVHLLASAYGWDLGTIEGLPRHRRQRLSRMVADA